MNSLKNISVIETLPICDSEIECLVLLSNLPFGMNSLTRLYLGIPISIIGLFLNVTCIVIFSIKTQFKTIFFSYNKMFSIKCAATNFLDILYYLFYNQILLSKNNFMISIITIYLWETFFTFGGIIECLIILHTIGVIRNKKFQILEKRSPYWIGTVIFLLLCLNNIPLFYQNNFDKKYFKISNSSKIYEVNNLIFSEFYYSQFGQILLFYKYVIGNLVLFFLEIIFNFYSLFLFQKLVKKKNSLVLPFCVRKQSLISKSENRKNLMVFLSSSFSLIPIIFYFIYLTFYLLDYDVLNKITYLILTIMLFLSFRSAVNFFFFYFLNMSFKKIINNLVYKLS